MDGPVEVAVAAVRLLAGPGAPGPGHRMLVVITLISWLLTASIGAYMLGTWIAAGGVGKQRASREGLSPSVVLGHASLATTGTRRRPPGCGSIQCRPSVPLPKGSRELGRRGRSAWTYRGHQP